MKNRKGRLLLGLAVPEAFELWVGFLRLTTVESAEGLVPHDALAFPTWEGQDMSTAFDEILRRA